ncbi:MAG: stage II sporulation protein R [Oscillospiraceae bacterium]|nr:stage II sporulation protein R [Oscillospiraceae bacterium]
MKAILHSVKIRPADRQSPSLGLISSFALQKHSLTLALLAGIAATFAIAAFTAFARESERAPDEVLRLHVMAESNSDADQAFKLQVRDFVLANFALEFADTDSLSAARVQALELLPAMEQELNLFAREKGVESEISVELTEMFFTTRSYTREFGGETLPAGTYSALRVIIGSGEGENWWCVMFPMLCLPAVSSAEEPPAQSVIAPAPAPAENSPRPQVKFAIFEALSRRFN